MITTHLISSGKGASGKSTFATVLNDLLRVNGHHTRLIDADPQKQILVKMYGFWSEENSLGAEPIVLGYDPDLENQPMEILTAIESLRQSPIGQKAKSKGDGHVIVDLAAESDIHLNRWIEDIALEALLGESDVKIIKWWVGDTDPQSLDELAKSSENFPFIQHVLVKNIAKAREYKWTAAIASNETLKAIETIEFTKLYGTLAQELRDSKVTWKQCVDNTKGDKSSPIPFVTANIVAKWMNICRENISQIIPIETLNAPTKKAGSKKEKAPAT
ncbi:MAG: hypothetical protein AAGL17_04940 [Cyanobacteria bacterium J06576_12]